MAAATHSPKNYHGTFNAFFAFQMSDEKDVWHLDVVKPLPHKFVTDSIAHIGLLNP